MGPNKPEGQESGWRWVKVAIIFWAVQSVLNAAYAYFVLVFKT